MSSISSVPTTLAPLAAQPAAAPAAAGDVRDSIGEALRGAGAGYRQSTKEAAIQADKGAIHMFESVVTGTGLIKQGTSKIPVVSKATGMLHTAAGFIMLLQSGIVSGGLQAPGLVANDLANRVASLVDGKDAGVAAESLLPLGAVRNADGTSTNAVADALASLGANLDQA